MRFLTCSSVSFLVIYVVISTKMWKKYLTFVRHISILQCCYLYASNYISFVPNDCPGFFILLEQTPPNLLFCQQCHSNTFPFSMLLALPGWWRACWDCHGKSVFIWRTKAICTLRKLSSYLLQTAEPCQLKSLHCDAGWKQWLQHHEMLFWVGCWSW